MKELLTRTGLLIGLLCFCSLVMPVASAYAESFHFTITSDQRGGSNAVESGIYFSRTLQAINGMVGGPGAFHVSVGDIDYAATNPSNRALIDANFGSNFPWFGVVGNHDAETAADMQWLRNEYDNGQSGARTPLKDFFSANPGPDGSTQTTYSWDYGNAHFIVLNCYWNGETDDLDDDSDNGLSHGDDSGDIDPNLLSWLQNDLAAANKPFIFIFVHEPAFPYNHHYGDSLDNYPDNRDAFWSLLESEKVSAVFVGHNHYYYKHQGSGGPAPNYPGHTYNYPEHDSWRTQDPNIDSLYGAVWQISTGNAGWEPGGITAGPTEADYLPSELKWNGLEFIDVNVTEDFATINVYRDARKMTLGSDTGLNFVLADTITISGGFIAYNDCVYDPGLVAYGIDPCGNTVHYGDPNFITVFGIGTPNSQQQYPNGPGVGYADTNGFLKDYTTGANTNVRVALTQSGGVVWQPMVGSVGADNWTGGYDTAIGTDAYDTFHGIVDMTGVVYYGPAAGWYVDANFTGLDPSKTYTFATSASRAKGTTDGEPNAYLNRWTVYTISGIDGAANASTPGTTEYLGDPLRVRFNTGENHNEGYVARWTGISPGADGSFKVRAEADPASESGYKAYAFDVFMLEEEPTVPDDDPPMPNPMTWASLPTATGPTTITMTATTATEPNYPPVKYYFECTTDAGKSSGWQVSPTYIANDLNPSTLYTFRVKARDNAPSLNETGWSSEQSATTPVQPPEVGILGSWVTGTTHAKEAGTNRALIFIAHGERSTVNPSLTSVTYGGKTMTKIVERLQTSGTYSRAYVAAFYLNEADVNTAASSTFVPTWTNIPSPVEYRSVFLQNVNQTTPIGATANNGSTSGYTLATSALSTADGDMVIEGSANSSSGTYTANNDFTKDFDSSSTSYDAMDGHKSATGADEIPSITHTVSSSRKALIGFVVQVASVDVPDVVGMTETAAEAALNAVTLVKGTVTYECSDTVTAGDVISSNPIAGTTVLCGSAVNLVISYGQPVVPDVIDMNQANATALLDTVEGISYSVYACYSDTAAEGNIAEQSAVGEVACGTAIDLTVSLGQPEVPDVTNMREADAIAAINSASGGDCDNGIRYGSTTIVCSDTVEGGYVISQTVTGTTACNTVVDLVLSYGQPVVPNVVGMDETSATALLGAVEDISVGTITYECSDTVTAGLVISQSLVGAVNCGSAVDLVISSGPAVVPNVVGMTESAAEAALIAASLVKGNVTSECSDTVALGDVISSSPAASTVVSCGSAVDLVISTGQPVVPDVTDMNQASATALLDAVEGISYSVYACYSDTVAEGYIAEQSAVGEVACGTAIDLTVSLGQPVVPDVTNIREADAIAAINAVPDGECDNGISYGSTTIVCSDTVEGGYVISQTVTGTTACNTVVDLVISYGQPVVPDVVGMDEASATALLDAVEDISVGTITYECNDTVIVGNVISQSAVGTVACGTVVDLAVSTGPCPRTISGYITEPDVNVPVEGVLVNANNGGGSDTTDANGYYQLTADYGWSGTVTPSKTGYTFEPNAAEYNNVTTDKNDNYTAILNTFIISGYVEDSTLAPLSGVLMSPDNGGGPFTSKYYGGGGDTTNTAGYYQVVVDYNWSGNIVPSRYAYAFEPNSIAYANVTESIAETQDYVGTLLRYTITGSIKNSCQVPIEGVLVAATSGGNSDTTDANGFYEVWVDYNWSGTVTPSKNLNTFDPNSSIYTSVLDDVAEQNYLATNIYDLDCDSFIGYGDIEIICENWLEDGQDILGDFDDSNSVNFIDFAEFAAIW